MSDNTSNEIFLFNDSSLPPKPKKKQKSELDSLSLSEVSPKDKPWDKHRRDSDVIAEYCFGGDDEFKRYGERVSLCSQLLDFKLVPEKSEGAYKLKLSSAKFCRFRHCIVCQWRRSLRLKARAYKAFPKIVADYPKYRFLFLTLTVKNCELLELRSTLDWMNKSFTRLTQLKSWPGKGWIKSIEVTRGRDGRTAHPHIHCLLMVSSSYFSGRDYLSQKNWVEIWRKSLRVDYNPMLDVQAIKPDKSPTVLLSEVVKYQSKPSDLISSVEYFREYVKQVHKTKAIAIGGVFRDYMRELEEEPEDLIGQDETEVGVDEGHLYFGWRRNEKSYKLIDT